MAGEKIVQKALQAALEARAAKYIADPVKRAENLAKFQNKNIEGIPPVVYHGTGSDVNQFDTSKGAWFSQDPSLANEYANKPMGSVIPAHISINNPIEFVHAEQRKPIGEVISTALSGTQNLSEDQINNVIPIINDLRSKYGQEARPLFEYWNNDPDVTKLFKELGYDGISTFERADRKNKTWSVFSPEQIKSSIGNIGEFDPSNPRITENRGGVAMREHHAGGSRVIGGYAEGGPTMDDNYLMALIKSIYTGGARLGGDPAGGATLDHSYDVTRGIPRFDMRAPFVDYTGGAKLDRTPFPDPTGGAALDRSASFFPAPIDRDYSHFDMRAPFQATTQMPGSVPSLSSGEFRKSNVEEALNRVRQMEAEPPRPLTVKKAPAKKAAPAKAAAPAQTEGGDDNVSRALWAIYNETGNPADFIRASNAMREGHAGGSRVISKALQAVRNVEPEDRLMMVHNLKSRHLGNVEKLGGLPVPSTAIIKPEHGFTSFGDITMVAPVEMAVPSRTNPIFGADVYSPRFPSLDESGERIFKGFSPSGTRRYSPLTLENAVKEMKGNIRGGEGFNTGNTSIIRAGVAPQFKSIEEIQGARDKIIPAETFYGLKDEPNKQFEDLSNKFFPHYNYGGDEWRHQMDLADMLRTAGMGNWGEINRSYKQTLPPELKEEAKGFLDYLRQMPTEYFEGKPQRAVNLSEFSGAVVPQEVADKYADQLRRLGVNRIETYDPSEAGSQAGALRKFEGNQFASGGHVLSDDYPTHYLPNVGRQVMADGGDAHQRIRAALDLIGRYEDKPPMDPEVMGQNWANAVQRFRDNPLRPGETVARPLELGGRDVVGGAIAGGDRNTYAGEIRRRAADALVGSTGLPNSGTLGFGLADVPMVTGVPLQASDIAQSIREGDYFGAGMNAAMPAAFYARKPIMEAGRRAVELAREYAPHIGAAAGVGAALSPDEAEAGSVQKALNAIRAYHGSPHKFDRFDISKIGTGEGAQAYGHGLYFAQNEDVARGYRDQLRPNLPQVIVDGENTGKTIQQSPNALKNILLSGKTPEEYYQSLLSSPRAEDLERKLRTASKDDLGLGFSDYDMALMERDNFQKTLDDVRQYFGKNPKAEIPVGHMYEVNINANPEHLLDWDKAIGEQPENVIKSLQDRGIINMNENIGPSSAGIIRPLGWTESVGRMPGEKLYRRLIENKMQGLDRKGAEALASRELEASGIPGIKYFDSGSRGAGEGSRNYVVFNDKLIDLLRRYADGGSVSHRALMVSSKDT